MSPSLCVVAGEASGDAHAGAVLDALKEQIPKLRSFGVGGARMRAGGFEALYDVRDMGVVGFTEIVRKLPFYFGAFRRLLGEIGTRRPDAVVLVDFPDFNLRLGKKIRALLEPLAGVKEIEEIHAHRYGPYLVVNLTIGVDGALTVAQGDRIATRSEEILLEEIESIRRVYVHYHPAGST